jgi:hypothetical protein
MPPANYRHLLECLFSNGLIKSESLIKGLNKFFLDSYFDLMAGRKADFQISRSIGNGLVECLSSDDYKIVEVAAKVLREYINRTGEIPQNSIPALLEALTENVPTSATQVSFTLGCIGCTKPSIALLPDSMLRRDIDIELCWDCSGGFIRKENSALIVPGLINGLQKPKSKDRSRKVRRACAIALGEIGYTYPESVYGALKPLKNCLKEELGRDGIIFALGSVGYTKPDLIEDLIPKFKFCTQQGYGSDTWACHNALKKIGMQTDSLVNYGLTGKKPLSDIMETLLGRMKVYEGSLASESIFAFSKLASKFPNEVISYLTSKLAKLHDDSTGSGFLSQNITITMAQLSKEIPGEMEETIPILIQHFIVRDPNYRTMDCTTIALKNIFKANPGLIPQGFVELLNDFLRNERRGSVVDNTKKLLQEVIAAHNEAP